jgi:uncharacterized membrane protein YfcA
MFFDEFDNITILIIAVAFLIGGLSKGVVGFGLPLITIPIMANVLPVPAAIALTATPILVSNLFQTFQGGRHGAVLSRFWPYVVMMIGGVLIGAQILTRANHNTIAIIVGSLLLIFVASQFMSLQPAISVEAERWLNPLIGGVSGLLGGVSSMFGPIAISYLVALKLSKDEFISTIGLFYLVGIVPLYATLLITGTIARDEIIASVLACIPLYIGLLFGAWLRRHISQRLFQRGLLIALVFVSVNLIRRGLM